MDALDLLRYKPPSWILILQVDLQRKIEERNRLLGEYKVRETSTPATWRLGEPWKHSSCSAPALAVCAPGSVTLMDCHCD